MFFCSIFVSVGISPISGEDPPLEMNFRKIIGTSIGSKIQGKFTINCDGGDNITSLSLLFNGTQVALSSTNSLSFTFDTGDFEPGMMNITLIGEDSGGTFSQITQMMQFLSDSTGIVIPVVIGGIAIVIVIFRYFRKKSQTKQLKSSTEDIKKRIKIDVDKSFWDKREGRQ